MTATEIYFFGIGVGILLGWLLHDLLLQVAYRCGIVKYIGVKK